MWGTDVVDRVAPLLPRDALVLAASERPRTLNHQHCSMHATLNLGMDIHRLLMPTMLRGARRAAAKLSKLEALSNTDARVVNGGGEDDEPRTTH
jgi:hypothetical protein